MTLRTSAMPRLRRKAAKTNTQKNRIRPRIMRFVMALESCFLALALPFAMAPAPVHAQTNPYHAEVGTAKDTLGIGQTKLITLKFKNIGSKTWTAGRDATAVYLYGNSSIFGHTSWLKNDLPAIIREGTVKPGQMASASFYVTAPQKSGVYTERFLLSYGPNAWIKGSVVTVTFTVVAAPPASATQVAPTPTTSTSVPGVPASSEYKAVLVDKGGIESQVAPEEHLAVDLKFKNVGTKTWVREGSGYISLYTWNPKYRKSPFKDSSWKSDSQAALLLEREVKPGQVGTIRLQLRGAVTPGRYEESFQLAAEDIAWVDGGTVTLSIFVTTPDSYIAKGITPGGTQTITGSYNSILLLVSHRSVSMPGNDRLKLTHGFKNVGTATWNSLALKYAGVAPDLGSQSVVRDDSWPSSTEAANAKITTAPGEIGFVSFTIKAPAKRGDYTLKFQLTADGQNVEGGEIDIPVTVTADGYVDPTPIPTPGPVITPDTPAGIPPLNGDYAALPNEPIIRVGLFKTTDDKMVVRGIQTGMTAVKNGTVACSFAKGQEATVSYSRTRKIYTVTGPGCSDESTSYYVMTAEDGVSPLEMTDFNRPVSWLPGANDNKFRAKLELRFTPATNNVWVINELMIEDYLKGIAETSDVSPLEYQKALLTAARTYAMYHVNRGTKHANEFFIVDATYDQVYRGYGQEARSPNIVDGVVKTRGQIVTYDGKLAITPYFSRSDGRTRDWTEVWYGSGFPWLKSVPVPHDVGQTLWGHGVGLSARGALYMASKDKATYDQILKHFYQGIELRQAYK